MRYCADIAMFAIDRPVASCKWATEHCRTECYNRKLYAMYPEMRGAEKRLGEEWDQLTGETLRRQLERKRRDTGRVRLMTRGEAFTGLDDMRKVLDLCRANPGALFWAPTRAWRNPSLIDALEDLRALAPNLRLMASTDPTTTREEWDRLEARGWSTMYFGTDTPRRMGMVRCRKTWDHEKGACATCSEGCFSTKQVDVHLRSH